MKSACAISITIEYKYSAPACLAGAVEHISFYFGIMTHTSWVQLIFKSVSIIHLRYRISHQSQIDFINSIAHFKQLKFIR